MKQENNNPHLFRVPKVTTVTGRMDFVLDRCKGKKVLHLGCVDEGLTEERIESRELLHFKLISIAAEVRGVDISEEYLSYARESLIGGRSVDEAEEIESIEEIIDL